MDKENVVYTNTGMLILNLVTCEAIWMIQNIMLSGIKGQSQRTSTV